MQGTCTKSIAEEVGHGHMIGRVSVLQRQVQQELLYGQSHDGCVRFLTKLRQPG